MPNMALPSLQLKQVLVTGVYQQGNSCRKFVLPPLNHHHCTPLFLSSSNTSAHAAKPTDEATAGAVRGQQQSETHHPASLHCLAFGKPNTADTDDSKPTDEASAVPVQQQSKRHHPASLQCLAVGKPNPADTDEPADEASAGGVRV